MRSVGRRTREGNNVSTSSASQTVSFRENSRRILVHVRAMLLFKQLFGHSFVSFSHCVSFQSTPTVRVNVCS